MAKVMRICKNCGKEYEACYTQKPYNSKVYRWQDVACSPECGQAYLAAVIASRAIPQPEEEQKAEASAAEEPAEEKKPKQRSRRSKKSSES